MARIIKIVTSSFATMENTRPPFNIRPATCEENVSLAETILDTAASYQPDLVLLPETFKNAGRTAATFAEDAETMDGKTVQMLSQKAKQGHYNLVAGLLMKREDHFSNEGLVFSRDGMFVGSYAKNYPVEDEMRCGIVPGNSVPVFELDFGRIGVAVCFDLNWREVWESFAKQKIDLACWISAYEGGFPLTQCAQWHRYPIASSVFPYHGKVIDSVGTVLAKTSRWNRIAYCELNLDSEIYHTDMQHDKIMEIQRKLGRDVTLQALTEEHLFVLTNYREDCTVKDIEKEFGLVSYDDYIARCTAMRNKMIKPG